MEADVAHAMHSPKWEVLVMLSTQLTNRDRRLHEAPATLSATLAETHARLIGLDDDRRGHRQAGVRGTFLVAVTGWRTAPCEQGRRACVAFAAFGDEGSCVPRGPRHA